MLRRLPVFGRMRECPMDRVGGQVRPLRGTGAAVPEAPSWSPGALARHRPPAVIAVSSADPADVTATLCPAPGPRPPMLVDIPTDAGPSTPPSLSPGPEPSPRRPRWSTSRPIRLRGRHPDPSRARRRPRWSTSRPPCRCAAVGSPAERSSRRLRSTRRPCEAAGGASTHGWCTNRRPSVAGRVPASTSAGRAHECRQGPRVPAGPTVPTASVSQPPRPRSKRSPARRR